MPEKMKTKEKMPEKMKVEMEKAEVKKKLNSVVEMEKVVVHTKSKSLDTQPEWMKMMMMQNLKEKMMDKNTSPIHYQGGQFGQPSVQIQDNNALVETKSKSVLDVEKAVAKTKSISVLDPESLKMMTMKNQYTPPMQPSLQLLHFDPWCCPPKERKWATPPENWIKINIGGPISNGKGSSVCIARNYFGMAMGCWTTLSTNIPSEEMESKALCLGITLALSNKWEKIIFEGDLEWIISAVTNPGSSSRSHPTHLVEAAKVFLQQHCFWEVAYSHWTTNEAAFELAHWALESRFSGALQPHELPRQVSQVVVRELATCSSSQHR